MWVTVAMLKCKPTWQEGNEQLLWHIVINDSSSDTAVLQSLPKDDLCSTGISANFLHFPPFIDLSMSWDL